MLAKQIGVIAACGLIGTALFLLPRTAIKASDESRVSAGATHFDETFLNQLAMVKQKLEPTQLFRVEFFQEKFETAEKIDAKVQWLDSIINIWDKLMRPGIAAEYAVKKAEITMAAEDWQFAGKRYTNMLPFFNGDEKLLIGSRAIFCLEQAKSIKGADETIETFLAIAKVSGSDEPMAGILKLRELADSNPANKDAQLNLGYFSMETGQYEKAIERFTHVLLHHPDELVVLFYISEAHLALGNKNLAVKALNDFINQVDPDETEAIQEAQKRIHNIIN